jgi:hypothetical protein
VIGFTSVGLEIFSVVSLVLRAILGPRTLRTILSSNDRPKVSRTRIAWEAFGTPVGAGV